MEYRFRMNQEQLGILYESAKSRIDAHPDVAEKHQCEIQKSTHYESEKEALSRALELERENPYSCQIWAKIEKVDDIYRIQKYWLVTDDVKIKMAADYIGMALMYDETRLQNIIYNKVKIDDVIAYYE